MSRSEEAGRVMNSAIWFPDFPRGDMIERHENLSRTLEKKVFPGHKRSPVPLPPKRVSLGVGSSLILVPSSEELESGSDYNPVEDLNTEEYRALKPQYPSNVEIKGEIKIGMPFDILSLLSPTDYIHLSTPFDSVVSVHKDFLRRTHLLVCCCFVPILWNSVNARSLCDLISVFSDFFHHVQHGHIRPIKMLMVAHMRRDWVGTKGESAFKHFFSHFPGFCLAVPFEDDVKRDTICRTLKLVDGETQCLLLDPDQRVLLHTGASFFQYRGADCFPFTTDKKELCFWPCWTRPCPSRCSGLDNLLGWDCSKLQLWRYKVLSDGGMGPIERITMSALKGKVVGFYLCYDGFLMRQLDHVHQQCIDRGLELEVVLVFMCTGAFNYDVFGFQKMILAELHKWQVASSWWVMQFKDSVSRRLSRLCVSMRDEESDRLIIVSRDGKVEPYAASIMKSFGGVDAYPFTRQLILSRTLNKANSLTIKSLLPHTSQDHLLTMKDNHILEVSLNELENNNVIFYFDFDITEACRSDHVYDPLVMHYTELKWADPGLKVVVFCYDPEGNLDTEDTEGGLHRDCTLLTLSNMPSDDWLLLPYSPANVESIQDKLVCSQRPTLIAFGKDGRVRSLEAHNLLYEQGPSAFPFNIDIRQEIIDIFADLDHLYMRGLSASSDD